MAGITTHHSAVPDAVLLEAYGEFDRDNRELLCDAVEQAMADGRHTIAIDLSGVTFLDAGTVRTLLECRQLAIAEGGRLELVNATGIVARVLEITATARTGPVAEPAATEPAGRSARRCNDAAALADTSAELIHRSRDLVIETRRIIEQIHR